MKLKHCIVCEDRIPPDVRRQITCSPVCGDERRRWTETRWYSEKKLRCHAVPATSRNCVICCDVFIVHPNHNQRTCGPKCSLKLRSAASRKREMDPRRIEWRREWIKLYRARPEQREKSRAYKRLRQEHYAEQRRNRNPSTCVKCKSSFVGHRLNLKYCSEICRKERRRELYLSSHPIFVKKSAEELRLTRRKYVSKRRALSKAASIAMREAGLLSRPPGLSKQERRRWDDAALIAARSLGLITNLERNI